MKEKPIPPGVVQVPPTVDGTIPGEQTDLVRTARGAWHMLQSLLAVREGIPDESIRTMADALLAAIDRAATVSGEPKPEVMAVRELGPILHVGTTRLWQLEKAGELAFLEIVPRIGNKARYSGKKVQQWIDGELAPPPRSFGALGRARRG